MGAGSGITCYQDLTGKSSMKNFFTTSHKLKLATLIEDCLMNKRRYHENK